MRSGGRAVRTLRRQAPPRGIYESSFDWGVARAICSRLAAGESLRSICREDPAMPTEKTVWNWARARPQFAAMRDRAIITARTQALAEQAARDADKRAYQAVREMMPGARRAWNRGLSGYSPRLAEAICARLGMGETLQSVCRDPEMPCVATVYNWMRARPDFLEAYRAAKEAAFYLVVERTVDRAPWLETEAASMRALEALQRAALRRCAQLAPKRYAPTVYREQAPHRVGLRPRPARRDPDRSAAPGVEGERQD